MEPILLAYLGVALMVALTGVGSAYGVTICGNAVVGAMKKNPDSLGSYIALSALPSSQGLYGFVGYFMLKSFLVAGISSFAATAVFGAGLAMGLVAFSLQFARHRFVRTVLPQSDRVITYSEPQWLWLYFPNCMPS